MEHTYSMSQFANKAEYDKAIAALRSTKPTVHYKESGLTLLKVGERASVIPLDHPDAFNVDNGLLAWTSTVLEVDEETGNFVTRNSRYVRVL